MPTTPELIIPHDHAQGIGRFCFIAIIAMPVSCPDNLALKHFQHIKATNTFGWHVL